MTLTKTHQTVEFSILFLTYKVENHITYESHVTNWEVATVCIFNLLWSVETDNFLYIPIVDVPVFYEKTKQNVD